MLGAAERLCTYLTTLEQKRLGYDLALQAFSTNDKDPRAGMVLARCAYFRADWEETVQGRAGVSQVGVAAASVAGSDDNQPSAAYYHALDLGIAMRDQGLGAIGKLGELAKMLKTASTTPDQDLGGPLRVMGKLYLQAPPWPLGIGDLDAGLELLKEAVDRYPSHPMNHLFYAELLLKDDRVDEAVQELVMVHRLARPELWGDYAARWQGEATAIEESLPKH